MSLADEVAAKKAANQRDAAHHQDGEEQTRSATVALGLEVVGFLRDHGFSALPCVGIHTTQRRKLIGPTGPVDWQPAHAPLRRRVSIEKEAAQRRAWEDSVLARFPSKWQAEYADYEAHRGGSSALIMIDESAVEAYSLDIRLYPLGRVAWLLAEDGTFRGSADVRLDRVPDYTPQHRPWRSWNPRGDMWLDAVETWDRSGCLPGQAVLRCEPSINPVNWPPVEPDWLSQLTTPRWPASLGGESDQKLMRHDASIDADIDFRHELVGYLTAMVENPLPFRDYS